MKKSIQQEPLVLLLVEDNPAHAEMFVRSVEHQAISIIIKQLDDGQAALDYICRKGEYQDETNYPFPDLVVLDLRLPKVDGLEVLHRIKTDESLKNLPVAILTTSRAQRDVGLCYNNYANSYVVKPLNFEKFKILMGDLGIDWKPL